MTEPNVTDDPIYQYLARQDEYWKQQGGRDESYTNGVSFGERFELVLRELEETR